jgi:hypothetical protein
MDNNNHIDLLFADAVGIALNTKVKLFVSCEMRKKSKNNEIKTKRVILCIGQDKVYIFNRSVDNLKFDFELDNIEELILDKLNTSSILLILKDEVMYKEQKIPYIYLIVNNRENLVKEFMAVYATHYAFQHGKVTDLVIKQKEVKFSQKFTVHKNLIPYHRPPDKYKSVIYKEYV